MENKGAVGVGAVFGIIGYLTNCLNEMLGVLVLVMLIDFILGIAASIATRKSFDWTIFFFGLFKKLGYGAVILLGYCCDYLILFITTQLGIHLPFNTILGGACTVYLIGYEGMSCVRNSLILKMPAPDFLLDFFSLVKDQAGKVVKKQIDSSVMKGGE